MPYERLTVVHLSDVGCNGCDRLTSARRGFPKPSIEESTECSVRGTIPVVAVAPTHAARGAAGARTALVFLFMLLTQVLSASTLAVPVQAHSTVTSSNTDQRDLLDKPSFQVVGLDSRNVFLYKNPFYAKYAAPPEDNFHNDWYPGAPGIVSHGGGDVNKAASMLETISYRSSSKSAAPVMVAADERVLIKGPGRHRKNRLASQSLSTKSLARKRVQQTLDRNVVFAGGSSPSMPPMILTGITITKNVTDVHRESAWGAVDAVLQPNGLGQWTNSQDRNWLAEDKTAVLVQESREVPVYGGRNQPVLTRRYGPDGVRSYAKAENEKSAWTSYGDSESAERTVNARENIPVIESDRFLERKTPSCAGSAGGPMSIGSSVQYPAWRSEKKVVENNVNQHRDPSEAVTGLGTGTGANAVAGLPSEFWSNYGECH